MYTYFPPPLTRIFRSIDQTCGAELRRSIERLRMTGLPEAPMISIVDDDVSVREATKALVRSLGHKVTTYGSAEEFLGSERISDTCCLITDVQMPGLNGLELQGRLIAEGYRIPVIFMTAFPEESARSKALKAGALGFLSKPFDEDSLLACLHLALTNGRATSPKH